MFSSTQHDKARQTHEAMYVFQSGAEQLAFWGGLTLFKTCLKIGRVLGSLNETRTQEACNDSLSPLPLVVFDTATAKDTNTFAGGCCRKTATALPFLYCWA